LTLEDVSLTAGDRLLATGVCMHDWYLGNTRHIYEVIE
jgi:hypothetical protein